ncbi:MAG: hypothetical protein NC412_04230 [Roseburia sp.]|nr:hypothetical protein [Roseburia sp.]MCM1278111.1 hypothetical protein [Robinsoniella sp.]
MEEESRKRVRYGEKYCPAFQEGDYRLAWNQQITVKDEKKNQNIAFDHNESSLDFTIGCDRFRINPGLIHSTYPPSFAEGEFDTHIPQITFMNDSFPWERTCAGEGCPWGILFLFDELDGVEVKNMTIEEAFIKKAGCGEKHFVPDISCRNGEKETDACTVLDIPGKLFEAVMPKKEELPLLAHIRQVDVEDKASHLYITEGKFASVIGNRLCRRSEEKLLTNVHFISLEGYGKFFGSDREKFKGYEKVRVISLTDWKFISYNKNNMGFRKLSEAMEVGYFGQIKQQELKRQDEGWEKEQKQLLENMLQTGYRPLNHETREGMKTVSWYKSPLLPYIPEFHVVDQNGKKQNVYEGYKCLSQSDAALGYISSLYMLDTTYGAAWQLGRLLALKNQELLGALYDIRRKNYEKDSYEKSMQMVRDILQEKKEEEATMAPWEIYGSISESCLHLFSNAIKQTDSKAAGELERQLGGKEGNQKQQTLLWQIKRGEVT